MFCQAIKGGGKMTESERRRQKRRYERRKAAHPTLCRVCGKVVEPTYSLSGRMSSRHYHEECIIDEAIKAVQDGCRIKGNKALQRAKNRNITKAEIIEIMQEKGIEYKPKRHKG